MAVALTSVPAAAQVNAGKGLTGLWLLDQQVYDKSQYNETPAVKGGPPSKPPLLPAVQAKADAARKARDGGAVLSEGNKKCQPHGMPGMMSNEFAIEFLETPGVVTVISEDAPLTRTISLTRKTHNTDQEPGWVGDSIGHWDNKGHLIVETTNLNDRISHIPQTGDVSSLSTKIIEKYHLENGGKRLINEMTFIDPTLLSAPWTVTYAYHRGDPDAQLWEYACEVDAPGWAERFQGDPQYQGNATKPVAAK
jgi:hypothetical protein